MVHVDLTDGIATLRFERPPANAIDLEAARALEAAFERLEADASVRAVVVTGQGRFFSAGLDLKAVPSYGPAEQREMILAINRLLTRLYGLPLPAIAAVNGHAIAGGLVVALACDYRVGAAGPFRLGLTETRVAVPYPVAAMTVVRTELSPPVARRLVLVARSAGPEDAVRDGVLDEVQPAAAMLARAHEVATDLGALPREAYARIKRQLRATPLAHMAEVVTTGADPLVRAWISAETAPAAASVLAERGPSGR